MATFQNNKKKDWFSHETGLVFVHGEVFKDGSRNLAIFKMELFATISNDGAYNQQYLHVTMVTRSSLLAKVKLDENGHALKVASDTPSYFVEVLLRFFESADYFLFH